MISSPPYATDESASDENTASARILFSRSCASRAVGIGRAQHQVLDPLHRAPHARGGLAGARAGHQIAAPHAREALVRRNAHEAVARLGAAHRLAPLQVRMRHRHATCRLVSLSAAHLGFAGHWTHTLHWLQCRAAALNKRSTNARNYQCFVNMPDGSSGCSSTRAKVLLRVNVRRLQ